MNIKRSRSTNFSKKEELLLLEEVNKFKDIIECKTTNKLTINEKEIAWQKVFQAFNARNFQTRTLTQIKSKFDNLKTKARKEVAMLKLNQAESGGSPSASTLLDSTTKTVLDIINLRSEVDFGNKFNNDYTNDVVIKEESVSIAPFLAEVGYNKNCESSNEGITHDSPNIVKQSNENSETLQSQLPTSVIEAKENYYKRKLEIMEKCFINDSIDRENRIIKVDEEHKKKMLLLDLEIEIKRKQLMKM